MLSNATPTPNHNPNFSNEKELFGIYLSLFLLFTMTIEMSPQCKKYRARFPDNIHY